ncbi:integrator complex subunit 10 isoform X2 [Zootermopsis nevadensis]|uniref:integrator complex subunit 10 isoform X2 n=1 Tax=Zootermopsis nevadensis TaxID=136037 RepID=UPI000B8E3949|nr:integrator complex subunit 10 isoform X2 [Zootermopsis nevadensis]
MFQCNFQEEAEMWQEVQALTTSLRSDMAEPDADFLRDMFSQIPLEVQHQLLLMTAEHSEDTMEHCRLLLLLLRRFPQTVPQHGPRLVDTLMTAEKHSHYQNSVNCFRKLLVCDLLPLLGSNSVDLPSKQLFRLLHKSIEFYLCYLMSPSKAIQDLPELESRIEDPWKNLFVIQEATGRKLGWELSAMFGHSWNKDLYWQKITQFHQACASVGDDHPNHKQLLYCITTFFLYCLHEYVTTLDSGGGEVPLVLVEAFCGESEVVSASVSASTSGAGESKVKRRKAEITDESSASTPLLTVARPANMVVVHNFLMAVRCRDLLHSSESLEREFTKLSQHLKLDSWLNGFLIDAALYKGRFDEAQNKIGNITALDTGINGNLRRHLRLASTFYCQGLFARSLEHILQVITLLPSSSMLTSLPSTHQLTNVLLQPSQSNRHLHFLPLTRLQVLQYCIKLLVAALKHQCLSKLQPDSDLAIGHIITLLQFDWPLEEELMTQLMERIRQRGSFSYSLFQNYVVNVDVLEEFMYLSTEQGGGISLDVMPSVQITSQRRISTRGTDKGVKEDFKLAMKRQVARSVEPLDNLIIKFLTSERDLLLQSLE